MRLGAHACIAGTCPLCGVRMRRSTWVHVCAQVPAVIRMRARVLVWLCGQPRVSGCWLLSARSASDDRGRRRSESEGAHARVEGRSS
eukprot:6195535-Pleurochrysis_carterae.AAC.4